MSDLKVKVFARVKKVLISSVIGFFLWLVKLIIKRAQYIREVALSNTFFLAYEIFPDNTISDNFDLSYDVISYLTSEKDTPPELNKEASVLLEEVLKDTDISIDVAKHFQVLSFAYSMYCKIFPSFKDEQARYFKKALEFNPTALPLKEKEVHAISKAYKKKAAQLAKERAVIIKERLNDERAKEIPLISVPLANIVIIISLISTLFVISGYYYIDQLLGHFGLNSSDFYALNDYTSASIEYAVSPLIYTIILIAAYLLGAYDSIGNKVWREQLSPPEKKKGYWSDPLGLPLFLMVTMNTLVIISSGFEGNHIPSQLALFNAFIVGMFCLQHLPYRLFINPMVINISVLVVFVFTYKTVLDVNMNLDSLKTGTYKPDYIVEFTKSELKDMNLEFITLNSNYIFMLEKNKLKAIPRSEVKELIPNPDAKGDSFLGSIISYFTQLAKLISTIYKEVFNI